MVNKHHSGHCPQFLKVLNSHNEHKNITKCMYHYKLDFCRKFSYNLYNILEWLDSHIWCILEISFGILGIPLTGTMILPPQSVPFSHDFTNVFLIGFSISTMINGINQHCFAFTIDQIPLLNWFKVFYFSSFFFWTKRFFKSKNGKSRFFSIFTYSNHINRFITKLDWVLAPQQITVFHTLFWGK